MPEAPGADEPRRPPDRYLDRIGEACQRYGSALAVYRAVMRDFGGPDGVRSRAGREAIELWAIDQVLQALTELTTVVVDEGRRRPPGGLT